MSNLYEYKSIINPTLHKRIFITDPKLANANIYINRDFSSVLQQLIIVRNWTTLSQRISTDELWNILKLHEFRSGKLVFDSRTGELIADTRAQAVFKKFYYNSLWFAQDHTGVNTRHFLNLGTLVFLLILVFVFYYITSVWQQQSQATGNNTFNTYTLLTKLETSTRAQQWQ